jgi:hypothetical protein
MMNSVAFLIGGVPGPACAIPEDKKIFRVSDDHLAAQSPVEAGCADGEQEAGAVAPLWPVPHMYSA